MGIDKDNVYHPYACGIYKRIIIRMHVVYTRELSSVCMWYIQENYHPYACGIYKRFCNFFLDYGGKLEAIVRCTKYRRSPPQGGLGIPVTLLIFKGDSSDDVYSKMQELVANKYI